MFYEESINRYIQIFLQFNDRYFSLLWAQYSTGTFSFGWGNC